MGKTKIEWCDYTINPVKGLCPMACPYCYARRMYKRFHWNETIQYDNSVFLDIPNRDKPSRIFVGSTMELFGNWVKKDWMSDIMASVYGRPEHTFIFLTKQPYILVKWSPFPDNCHIGISVTGTNNISTQTFGHCLSSIDAKVKFISFEPLLDLPTWWGTNNLSKSFEKAGVNWIIIGQQTPPNKNKQPKLEWIKEIIDASDSMNIPVFLKDNLKPLLPEISPFYNVCDEEPMATLRLRQEFPKV